MPKDANSTGLIIVDGTQHAIDSSYIAQQHGRSVQSKTCSGLKMVLVRALENATYVHYPLINRKKCDL
jgi:hypothetical protein